MKFLILIAKILAPNSDFDLLPVFSKDLFQVRHAASSTVDTGIARSKVKAERATSVLTFLHQISILVRMIPNYKSNELARSEALSFLHIRVNSLDRNDAPH